MSWVAIGLGSNLGDRWAHLSFGIKKLKALARSGTFKLASVYQSQALLKAGASEEWNLPYLNTAASFECTLSPALLLRELKNIETESGRPKVYEKWAPRTLDLDILLYDTLVLNTPDLVLPHRDLLNRAFVLEPLRELCPSYELNHDSRSLISYTRRLPARSTLLMGILNLTEDSFSSDGVLGKQKFLEKKVHSWCESNIAYIDLGAESTRPGAKVVSQTEEWERLEPALKLIQKLTSSYSLPPKISVDTRNAEVARKALDYNVDLLNDVSAFSQKEFLNVIAKSECDYLLMHSLGVPANSDLLLPPGIDPVEELYCFFKAKIAELLENGVKKDRIIIDPGIGFGKSSGQNIRLLKNLRQFFNLDCRVLVGHSRKSFLKTITKVEAKNRDCQTLGISCYLKQAGVDILRVHDPLAHAKAFEAMDILL